jgi:uncharacterized membrane protein YgcG
MNTSRSIRLFALGAMLALSAHSQQCESVSGITPTPPKLQAAIDNTVNAGADVRVMVINRMNTATLDAYEALIEHQCTSWRAPDGGRKNNLVALIVSTGDRKLGLYFGSQWPMLKPRWPSIESSVIKPRLRDGDIAGGIAAGLNEVTRLISAPPTTNATVVVEQPASSPPTDLSGLWTVLMWLVLLPGGCVLLWIVFKWVKASKDEREKRLGAQQSALIAQQEATDAMANASSTSSGDQSMHYYSALNAFGQLGSGALDPVRTTLTAAQYTAIEKRYRRVITDLKSNEQNKARDKVVPEPAYDRQTGAVGCPKPYVAPSRKEETAKVVHNTTIINETPAYHSGPMYQQPYVPIFIPEPVVVVEPERHHVAPTPSYDPPSRSSDSDSGGSSSWGSSSSSYDSGGSSSYDSGSSFDSGGGGSSDW